MTQVTTELRQILLRAYNLNERISGSSVRSTVRRNWTRAEQRKIERWRSWYRASGPASWEAFLDHYGVGIRQLLSPKNDARPIQIPPWAITLHSTLEALQGQRFEKATDEAPENLIRAIAAVAWKRVQRDNPSISAAFSAAAGKAWRSSLIRHLEFTLRGIVRDKRNSRARRIRKRGSTYSVSVQLLGLLRSYPVLARLWFHQVQQWQKFVSEVAYHAEALFLKSRKPGSPLVCGVTTDLSDPHRGGRTVVKVRFCDGTRVIYKPRSGRQELWWYDLLQWLNDEGFSPPFRIIEVRSSRSHSWMALVESRQPRPGREFKAFAFQFGALLYLIYLLRGVDFHVFNIVASTTQPVIIDCETLLHPVGKVSRAARAQEYSIFRTGILPLRRAKDRDASTRNDQCEMLAGIYANRRRSALRSRAFLRGFGAMHDFLRKNSERQTRFKRRLKALVAIPARRIQRPSADYFAILEESLHSDLLRDGLDRSLFIAGCLMRRPTSKKQFREELRCIDNAELPVCYSKRNRVPPVFLDAATFIRARAAIASLS